VAERRGCERPSVSNGTSCISPSICSWLELARLDAEMAEVNVLEALDRLDSFSDGMPSCC
jgi:hypothetical protein